MKKISAVKIIFLLVLYCLLLALSSPLSCAQNAAENTSALKDKNTRLQGENTKFKDKISYLENEVTALDNARKTSEETNRAFSRRMAELQAQLQSLEKDAENTAALKDETARLQAELKKVDLDRDEVLEKLKMIMKENTKFKDKNSYLENEVTALDNARKTSEETNRAFSRRMAELQTQLQSQGKDVEDAALKDETARLQEENTKFKDENSYLKKDVEDAAALKDETARLQEENTKFKGEISYLENEVTALDNARKAAEEMNRAFSRRMAELQTQLQSLKEAGVGVDKYKYAGKRGASSGNIEELKETIGALEVERAVYVGKKKALDKQLKETSSDFYMNNKELKRLRTESALMHYNLGVIFQKANKWREAIREYEKVIEILPNDADTHFNLAFIYETAKNDRNKALYHYQKYLETNPSAPDASAVKKRVTNINAENRIWGAPHLGGIKERTGRIW